ncbi:MAG: hypothetical protein IT422_10115 [Pirellulaceae bacterium]|jgi:hypothetical protein|nr:hypothetical protein [Pirellulaceae bacterium]
MRSIPASFTLLLILLGSLMPQKGSSAEPLTFPWGSARPAFPEAVQRASAASYHVLSTTVRHNASPALPVQPMAPKAAYSYGWFGSNPHSMKNSQWGRHFGIQQSYTQWTRR